MDYDDKLTIINNWTRYFEMRKLIHGVEVDWTITNISTKEYGFVGFDDAVDSVFTAVRNTVERFVIEVEEAKSHDH